MTSQTSDLQTASEGASGRAPVDVAHRLVEAMRAHDVEALVALWAPGGVEHLTTAPGEVRAPDGIRSFFSDLFAACPDHAVELVETVAEGDRVAMLMKVSGTFSGTAYDGVEPTGRRYEGVLEFAILEVRDGLIQRSVTLLDRMTFTRQIGFLPEEGGVQEAAMKAMFNLATRARRAISGA